MKLLFCLFAVMAAVKSDTNELLKHANQKFTAKMLSEVVKQNPQKSVVLSAFSVLTPLAQLSLASEGASHDELLNAIGMPNDNSTKEVFTSLTKDVSKIQGVELKLASKVYVAANYELNEQFQATTKKVFNSEVQNVNFVKNLEAAKTINTWVEDQTNKRIKDLVEPSELDGSTRAVLVNAIYFKGSWLEKFDPKLTQNKKFQVSKDKSVDLPFMYKNKNFKYGESQELNAQLLELPYQGEEASFLVVLPREVDGLAALEEKLKDPTVLQKAIDNMSPQEVNVYLPKFKIETTTDLKQALENMDVKKVFDASQAKLTGLLKSPETLFISAAKQKAFIEVNEEGAEAAAANEFGIAYLSAVISNPLTFEANHPFVFFLRKGDTILFSGVYMS
ncbi:antichymotrypsin-2-like isoform X16 [Plodia interpunctella]|uniref:antichymotrypsin-2-like isoform X16 n=1 Tax=Plodia interpunctella TaxID=58824 RepID=UPI002368B1F2|nr:antichymotrypsin-2-like isoform X16 [Plodia interpunctella]